MPKGSYSPYIPRPIFQFLQILDFWTFFIFVNMGPYESENFKTLLFELQFFFNQTFTTYSLWQSSQNLLIKTWKFQVWIFFKMIEIFLNMRPYGSENF